MAIVYLVAVVLLFLFVVIDGNGKKNRQLPGPFPLPLIGGAYVLFGHLSNRRLLYKLVDLLNKYSGAFSILLGNVEQIITSKPEHAQVYCRSPHLLDHSSFYDVFKPIFRESLFTANGAEWKARRRAWVPSFHPSLIRTFVKKFQDHADIFVKKLEKEVNGPEFLFLPYTRNLTIDAVLLTQFEFNHNSQHEFRKFDEATKSMSEMMLGKLFNIFLNNQTFYKLSTYGRKIDRFNNDARDFLRSIVREKKTDFADDNVLDDYDLRRNSFIRQLLNDRNITMEKQLNEMLTLGIAGFDTLSHTTAFIALMLGKHQDVQDKVYLEDQEIQRHLNGCELEMDDLPKYEYLDRVIKETLRLFPNAPVMGRKATQDIKMGDITVPKGHEVLFCTLALHRNPEIYPNPLVFNPDNFLPERIAERHSYSYIPFSGGPRNCIGRKYAYTFLYVIIPTLVRNYRLFSNANVQDIKLCMKIPMSDVANYPIRIEKREN